MQSERTLRKPLYWNGFSLQTGISAVEQRICQSGYSTVILTEIIDSSDLPLGTSAQLAELVALTRVLELNKDKKANIYMDSKYVYVVLHTHVVIWKERQFLTMNVSPIKYCQEID